MSYTDLGDGRFFYRRDQLWKNGDKHHVGQLCQFDPCNPASLAIVEWIDDEKVVFQMCGRPIMNTTGVR